jgi:hypothetical protein
MRHSRGAEQTERTFLMRKSNGRSKISERKAERKVREAVRRPIIVRYWKCQPYAEELREVSGSEIWGVRVAEADIGFGFWISQRNE